MSSAWNSDTDTNNLSTRDIYYDVIDNLMKMETCVNEEMALRYQNIVNLNENNFQNDLQQNKKFDSSLFTSSNNKLVELNQNSNSNLTSSSAFSHFSKPYTVESLNEVTFFKIKIRKLLKFF